MVEKQPKARMWWSAVACERRCNDEGQFHRLFCTQRSPDLLNVQKARKAKARKNRISIVMISTPVGFNPPPHRSSRFLPQYARSGYDGQYHQRQQQTAAVVMHDPQRGHHPEDISPHQHSQGADQAETPVCQTREHLKAPGERSTSQ